MDLDVAKALSRLQDRLLELESGTDLRDKCDTIIELDHRAGKLSNEIRSLHNEVDQRFSLDDVWQQLGHPYKILDRTNHILDLLNGLKRLNRICRIINDNVHLKPLDDEKSITSRLQQSLNSNGDDENEQSQSAEVIQILDLLDEFESCYAPLENILSNRRDLPYSDYSTRVRSLIKDLEMMLRS